jgi:AmpD protein
MHIKDGWLTGVKHIPSPFFDRRPDDELPSLLVIHNISLPPEQFGGPYIEQLFTGRLDPHAHPYFENIYQLKVSAHCLIRRNGEVLQFVDFDQRAWHAGVSSFQGREKCNDFSIGIELEGSDHQAFTETQYSQLGQIARLLMQHYPITRERITGHSTISPGRKTDPGDFFNWPRFFAAL